MAILDEVIKVSKPSNKKYITRYHQTLVDQVPSISKRGLLISRAGTGYDDGLGPEGFRGVFTSTNGFYEPYGQQVSLQIDIPKEDYRKIKRYGYNYNVIRYPVKGLSPSDIRRKDQSVQDGGRTDIFGEDIKPEWITRVITGEGNSYTPQEFVERLKCDPNVDDYCADFLRDIKVLDEDENGRLINAYPLNCTKEEAWRY